MKRINLLILFLSVGLLGVQAQTIYDGELLTQKDLSGSARFVGMGGALGALGADISTMGTNPAGIGLYRSYDFNTTFGYTFNEVKSNYMGNKITSDHNKFGLKSAGFVISNYMGDYGLKYVNFGFNYTRTKDFYRKTEMAGLLNVNPNNNGIISISNQMAAQADAMLDDGIDIADLFADDKAVYSNGRVGWLGAMGYDGKLIQRDDMGYTGYLPTPDVNSRVFERGGIDQYDFNISGNISDRFFFGLTIGAYDINYRSYSYYDEDYGNNEYGLIHTDRQLDGSGYDFKLGVIFRPVESSPFRIGLAVHSPIFYHLTNYTAALMKTQIAPEDGVEATEDDRLIFSPNDELGGFEHAFDFEINTPWKFNFSLGHNVADYLALGAEYEYQDYSSIKFKYDGGGNIRYINSTSDMLKGVHTLRLGAEFRVVPEFAFRMGYNIQTASFKKEAFKDIMPGSTITDAHYVNNSDVRNTFTFGLGYMGKTFYSDLAFKFDWHKSEFRPFDDPALELTKLTNNRSQVLFTLGMRL